MRLWCDDQILVSIDGPGGRFEERVDAPLARIGAHPHSDIVLSGAGVAKRAFYLHATSAGLYALSLDLQNIDPCQRGRWLPPDEELTIGEYRLTARLASGRRTPHDTAELIARGTVQPPLPVLNIHCAGLLKDKRRFRSRLSLLGRRPQCALQLKGAQVSSFHCALYWEQRRLWCIDLLSSNGTTHNGTPLGCEEVLLNDRLGVGEFELEYHRWSPRRSMVPGWEPAGDDALANEEPLSSSDALSDLPIVSGDGHAASGSSVISKIEPVTQIGVQLAEEVARLATERRDMQEQWSAAADRLAEQIGALQVESRKLSYEREALESARAQWQSERQYLAQELADRNNKLARIEAELAATTRIVQQRLSREEFPAGIALPQEPGNPSASLASASALGLASSLDLPGLPGPVADSQTPPAGDGSGALEGNISVLSTIQWSPSAGSPEDSGDDPAISGEPPSLLTASRRGKAVRDEMTTFVSDRLRDIESTKRRKSLVLWATVGAAALTISAAIWGAIVWLY